MTSPPSWPEAPETMILSCAPCVPCAAATLARASNKLDTNRPFITFLVCRARAREGDPSAARSTDGVARLALRGVVRSHGRAVRLPPCHVGRLPARDVVLVAPRVADFPNPPARTTPRFQRRRETGSCLFGACRARSVPRESESRD